MHTLAAEWLLWCRMSHDDHLYHEYQWCHHWQPHQPQGLPGHQRSLESEPSLPPAACHNRRMAESRIPLLRQTSLQTVSVYCLLFSEKL